jgi:hypothetical protein
MVSNMRSGDWTNSNILKYRKKFKLSHRQRQKKPKK